ncbi:DUF485 domain-containing protein [Saccharopolyspora erythraea]|nr:DUF485 domain-containing protein [Saccharopolyspora erythraea]QRK92607.1 DUF485 domain-containing protein [Saccharopolyspora erythraea]
MAAPSPDRPTGSDEDAVLVMAKRRRSLALGSAGVLLAGFLGYVALTTSTTVLSGRIAGLGTAYWAGFAIFGVILAVAHGYARWARRMDALVRAGKQRGERG